MSRSGSNLGGRGPHSTESGARALGGGQVTSPSQVFVANLPYSVTEELFRVMVYPFGNVTSARLIRRRDGTRAHQGYGFVSYADPSDALRAVACLNGAVVGAEQRVIEVTLTHTFHHAIALTSTRASFPSPSSVSVSAARKISQLFVCNVDYSLTGEDLRGAFEPYGAIAQAYLIPDGAGRHKGYGFVKFERDEAAERAKNEWQEFAVNGRAVSVDFSHQYKLVRKNTAV